MRSNKPEVNYFAEEFKRFLNEHIDNYDQEAFNFGIGSRAVRYYGDPAATSNHLRAYLIPFSEHWETILTFLADKAREIRGINNNHSLTGEIDDKTLVVIKVLKTAVEQSPTTGN